MFEQVTSGDETPSLSWATAPAVKAHEPSVQRSNFTVLYCDGARAEDFGRYGSPPGPSIHMEGTVWGTSRGRLHSIQYTYTPNATIPNASPLNLSSRFGAHKVPCEQARRPAVANQASGMSTCARTHMRRRPRGVRSYQGPLLPPASGRLALSFCWYGTDSR